MGLGCEWRHVRKRWVENLVISRKQLVEIWLWAGLVQLRMGLTVGDVGKGSIAKIVCLSLLVSLVRFYGISTFVGYLTPNPFLCK